MKAVLMLLAASFVVSSMSALVSAAAPRMNRVATCSAPHLDGDIIVYLASDNSSAAIVTNGKLFAAKSINLGTTVSSFDYDPAFQSERVVIAENGQHELHEYDSILKRFRKVADMRCDLAR